MLSVLQRSLDQNQSVFSPFESIKTPSDEKPEDQPIHIEEIFSAHDSLLAFQRCISSGQLPSATLRLQCTVPTWCSAPFHCHDLHDLHDLRSRSLTFLHELVKSLRSQGVFATHQLLPVDSDIVLIQCIPFDETQDLIRIDDGAVTEVGSKARGKTLMTVSKSGPVILMT